MIVYFLSYSILNLFEIQRQDLTKVIIKIINKILYTLKNEQTLETNKKEGKGIKSRNRNKFFIVEIII